MPVQTQLAAPQAAPANQEVAQATVPAHLQPGSTVSTADLYAQAAQVPPGTAPAQATPAATQLTTPAQVAQAQQQQWNTARDYARSLGFDPGQSADDASFLRDVFAQAAAARTYQQQLNALAAQQAAALRTGQPPAAALTTPATAPAASPWTPPDYNPAWEQMVTRDQTGNYQLAPGADPTVLPRYLAYHQYRRDFADRLLRDPQATLQPFIASQAEKIAQQTIQQQLQTYQDQVYTESFLRDNSAWLYQRDQGGNAQVNPATGKPFLSPAGSRFQGYVNQAANTMGIRDVRAQADYARGMLQRDILWEQSQQAQALAQGQAHNQQVVQQGNRYQPNHAGTIQPALASGNNSNQNPSLSLRDQLAMAMQQNGVSDQDLVNIPGL